MRGGEVFYACPAPAIASYQLSGHLTPLHYRRVGVRGGALRGLARASSGQC